MRLSIVAFLFIASQFVFAQSLKVVNSTCEYQENPMGMDAKTPRFSWQLTSDKNDVSQTAYEIRVGLDAANFSKNVVWQSGKVQSDQSILIPYGGPALKSKEKYFWQVRVTDNQKNTSPW